MPISITQPWRRLPVKHCRSMRGVEANARAAIRKHGAVMVYDDHGHPILRGRLWYDCTIIQYRKLPF
jgi:hypothetical protein